MRFALAAAVFLVAAPALADDLPPTLMDVLDQIVECFSEETPALIEECNNKVTIDAPNWGISTETDLITDKVTVTMSPPFLGGQNVAGLKPNLAVSCPNDRIIMMISGDFNETSDRVDVISRIDDGPPSISNWSGLKGKHGVFTTDTSDILPFLGAKTAVFRFTHGAGETATVKYDVSGFDDASRWFEKHCATWRRLTSAP